MEFKQIQELVKLINKSDLTEVQIEQKDFKLTIKKEKEFVEHPVSSAIPVNPAIPYAAPQQVPVAPPQASAPQAPAAVPASTEEKKQEDSHLITIKSPMIGTFYRSAGPDKPTFVSVGDEVAPGKVVCIVEAMKLFNEVESEISGKIVKILVDDASPVEYDQPLFLVEP